jgi:hypothetical protein
MMYARVLLLGLLPLVACVLPEGVDARVDVKPDTKSEKSEPLTPQQILKSFGYRGVGAVTERQAASYRRVFGFLDANRDGRHSKREYIDNGVHMNSRARRGIFQASDSDRDGFVSRAEYVENRIITDEAKAIFAGIDSNGDGRMTAHELVLSGKFATEAMSSQAFEALDTDRNGFLVIPEFLRVWGRWARGL